MRACTIVASNYLAYAAVLEASFREHHPEGDFHVLIVDDHQSVPDGLRVVRPTEILDEDEFLRMAAMYDIVELATALKPFLLRWLTKMGPEPVVYFDPDIRIYRPLEDVSAAVAEHHLVLVPHAESPIPRDGHTPAERDLMQVGVFNLGFIGVDAQAADFLDWWAERLSRDCLIAPERGLFVDQRWVDLAVGYFPNHIAREQAGWNVAYWNLHARALRRDEHGWWVDDRPLGFFHFSGVDASDTSKLSRHTGSEPRELPRGNEIVLELVSAYVEQLSRANHEEFRTLRYGYAVDGSGVPLSKRDRLVYRDAVLGWERFGDLEPPNPFRAGADFRGWVDARSAAGPTLLHSSRDVGVDAALPPEVRAALTEILRRPRLQRFALVLARLVGQVLRRGSRAP